MEISVDNHPEDCNRCVGFLMGICPKPYECPSWQEWEKEQEAENEMDEEQLKLAVDAAMQLVEGVSEAIKAMLPIAEGMIHSIAEAIETVYPNGIPNNWLKMHGYPMRRRWNK